MESLSSLTADANLVAGPSALVIGLKLQVALSVCTTNRDLHQTFVG